LIVRCAQTLQDLGLTIASTIPKASGGGSGALLFRLAHAVMWFATGEQAEYPSARDLRETAELFRDIAMLWHRLEQARCHEDVVFTTEQLRKKEALLAKL
jgi:N-dimethylarginine dimethylaminohydrolase